MGQEQVIKASAAIEGKSTRAKKVWSKIGFESDSLLMTEEQNYVLRVSRSIITWELEVSNKSPSIC